MHGGKIKIKKKWDDEVSLVLRNVIDLPRNRI